MDECVGCSSIGLEVKGASVRRELVPITPQAVFPSPVQWLGIVDDALTECGGGFPCLLFTSDTLQTTGSLPLCRVQCHDCLPVCTFGGQKA